MEVHVDRVKCEKHAQCIIAAPEVFSWDDDHELTWVPEPDEALHQDVIEAADACPVQAITVKPKGSW